MKKASVATKLPVLHTMAAMLSWNIVRGSSPLSCSFGTLTCD